MRKNKKIWACAFAAVLLAFAAVLWGSQRFLMITREMVAVNGLPTELNGLRILHITDLHAQSPERISLNIWDKAEELDFDIVVITGDIVDRNAFQIEPHLPYIKSLAERYPVFFCEGNHDHYSMKKLRPLLEGCGVTVLVDEKAEFDYNGVTVEVVGVTDYYTADFEVSASLFTETDKPFRLALFHQPQHAKIVDLSAVPCLVLSGHTHGGQWRVPFLPTLYAPGQGFLPEYGYGVYEIGGAKMYVSKGIGATGKMPLRIWNRPEISVITLTTEE